jgi:hypothetical protein
LENGKKDAGIFGNSPFFLDFGGVYPNQSIIGKGGKVEFCLIGQNIAIS